MAKPLRTDSDGVVISVRLSWLMALWTLSVRPLRRLALELRRGSVDALHFAAYSGVTVLLLSLVFQPLAWWPLAFVCLVPWAFAVCRATRPWVAHWLSFLFGWLFFLINLRWLSPVTGPGFVALAFYLGLYWTLSAWAIRTGRRLRIPVALTLPVAWVACEYLRGWVMSGFPWLLLGHSFAAVLPLIQVSDLVGAYGVSFFAGLVNGLIVDWLLLVRPGDVERSNRRIVITSSIGTVVLLGSALAYGYYRLAEPLADGPRVGVVQEDFVLRNEEPYSEPFQVIFSRYMVMAARAVEQHPDLIAFPETTWGAYQNYGFLELERQAVPNIAAFSWAYGKHCDRATSALARGDYSIVNQVIDNLQRLYSGPGITLPRMPSGSGPPTTLVVGAQSLDLFPEATYPKEKRFNSALIYDPDGVQRQMRYDKKHLVPFGEFVPFRNATLLGINFHWLYRFLNTLSPFSNGGKVEYSLWFGEQPTVFELQTAAGNYRFGTPICYEDVMPYLVHDYVWDHGQRRVDFLVNISNDGWFLHSAELPQHMAIAVFRAVENRVGIARAVNTGMSGFIDPDGRVYGVVADRGRTLGPGIVGVSVEPVRIDRRRSFYGLHGDWFAGLCLIAASLLWLGAILTRWIFALGQRLAGLVRRV